MHVHNYIVLCDVKVWMILMQRTIIGDVQLTVCMLGREREGERERERERKGGRESSIKLHLHVSS